MLGLVSCSEGGPHHSPETVDFVLGVVKLNGRTSLEVQSPNGLIKLGKDEDMTG